MCKLYSCLNDDCKWCLKRKEVEARKYLPINKRSKKREKQEREYSLKRKKILAERPICECGRIDEKGEVCRLPATEIHHKRGRIGSLLTDERYMLPINTKCHAWVTEHSKEAIEQGLSLRRNVEITKRK